MAGLVVSSRLDLDENNLPALLVNRNYVYLAELTPQVLVNNAEA